MYGGDGRTTFGLPDLRDAIPIGKKSEHIGSKKGLAEGTSSITGLIMNYCIHVENGTYPPRD